MWKSGFKFSDINTGSTCYVNPFLIGQHIDTQDRRRVLALVKLDVPNLGTWLRLKVNQ